MPEAAATLIAEWIKHYGCKFTIAKARETKFGDYRSPNAQRPYHQISVNGDMNPYAFLVTTVHEFAHLQTFNLYQHKVKPHGKEWKKIFRELMQPFLEKAVFPPDIHQELIRYLNNPSASSCTDKNLYAVLLKYNPQQEAVTYISQIPEGAIFEFRNRIFKKGEKRRTRYTCVELASRKKYLFSALAEVAPV